VVRKFSNIGATRCQTLRLKCTKFDGAYSAPRYPVAVFKGPISKEREGKGSGAEGKGKGMERRGKGRAEEGREGGKGRRECGGPMKSVKSRACKVASPPLIRLLRLWTHR